MAVFYMNKNSTCEDTRLLTVCLLEYFTDNTMGGNKKIKWNYTDVSGQRMGKA